MHGPRLSAEVRRNVTGRTRTVSVRGAAGRPSRLVGCRPVATVRRAGIPWLMVACVHEEVAGSVGRGRVELAVRVRAPVRAVWEAVTDWAAQGEWMTATRVRPMDGDGRGVGGRIEAFTGFGALGFLDTMVVTEWRPPSRCAVLHTGRLVRGTGAFAVEEDRDAPGAARLVWYEDLDLPAGALGVLGWVLLRPLVRLGVARSLGRLARSVECGEWSGRKNGR